MTKLVAFTFRSFLVFVPLWLPLLSSVAAASAVDACIAKLGAGQNRLNVKVSAKALQRLAEADFKRARSSPSVQRTGLLVDYSLNSKVKRAYLIDFASCDVLRHEYVIHGGFTRQPLNRDGDPDQDGMLDSCKNTMGDDSRNDAITSRTNMTRPGLYLTSGCHVTSQKGWPKITRECDGVKLRGLDKSNNDAFDAQVVLHEHTLVRNNSSIKPVGQGCPTFAEGKLKAMLRYDIYSEALVYIYAPQCL